MNADDFGLTPGVCAGILRAHRDGIVTSTSVLTAGPAFAAHVRALRDSGLPAGLHLAVVGEDPPLLSAAEIPSLVDRHGRFPISWRQFLASAARGAIDPADLDREFAAQRDSLAGAGIRATHVDTHQNLHLWPTVTSAVVRLALSAEIPVLRVTRSRRFGPVEIGVRALASVAARRARRAGLVVPDVAVGLDQAGSVDDATLREMITDLERGRGHADLTVHPASDPDPDRVRYSWGYSWSRELAAVCAPGVRDLVERAGFRLGSFADVALASRPHAAESG